MSSMIILLIGLFLCSHVSSMIREYGLLFEHDKSYLQTGYLTLCDECSIKLEVMINRTSGVLMYAENRVRGVTMMVYFDRPGVYANVTDGLHKYNLPLTLDFFSSEWFGWHELEIQISETKMLIMFDNSLRQTTLKGKHLFPENVVEENEIYFGTSPRWPGVKNVTGFIGFMKNFKYKSCGCDEWRAMEIVNMVGVSTLHLGECSLPKPCKEDCSCYLFSWGGKRCECPDLQCLQKSNDVSYDFDRFTRNLGRLHQYNNSRDNKLETGIIGDALIVNGKSSLILYVATGRSCFKNIFLCEKGFTHSFWILPHVTSNREVTSSMIMKHSSTLESTHGLTVSRLGNHIQASLVTHEGVQFNISCPMKLSIWSLVTIIFNKTHLSLYQNTYLMDVSTSTTKINHKFPELTSTRFLFVGNGKDNPHLDVDDFNFTYNVHLPRLPSIQELRLEQHSSLRKVNYDCGITIDKRFVDLSQCYRLIFRDYGFTEFYMSLIFNLQMEQSRMVLLQSPFINITSEFYTLLHIDLRGEMSQIVKLKLVASRLYYVEISMNSEGWLTVRQNINTVLLSVTLGNYLLSNQKNVEGILVNKDRNAVSDVRFINVNREFAKKALRIITDLKDVVTHSIDFDHNDIDKFPALQLTEGYIDQGLMLKTPVIHISANWFHGACLKYVASCYHGFTLSFWMKVINNFQHLNEPFFKVFSSGDRGISLLIGKDGLYFVMVVESQSFTKFIPAPNSFELYQWCLVELTVSPNGIASLFLNGREAQKSDQVIVPSRYKCSRICLREEGDNEIAVTLIVDEMKTWNVERDFLYANGFLSSDTQSLMQQKKNSENKAKQMQELNTVLQDQKKVLNDKLRILEIVVDELKKEIKSLICGKSSKTKKSINTTNQGEIEKNSLKSKGYLNDIFLEPEKVNCFEDNGLKSDSKSVKTKDKKDIGKNVEMNINP